jgi:formate dehydrogenase iron-sulfur subunit
VETARKRVTTLHERGRTTAYLYGAGDAPEDQLAGGLGAFFLLTEPPERYGLPAHADSPIQENVPPATLAGVGAGAAALAAVAAALLAAHRRASAHGRVVPSAVKRRGRSAAAAAVGAGLRGRGWRR